MRISLEESQIITNTLTLPQMLHNNQEWIFSTENILHTQTNERIHQISICIKFSPNKGDFYHQCMFVQCRYIVKQYHLKKNLARTYVFELKVIYIERFLEEKKIMINACILNMSFFLISTVFQKCVTLCVQNRVTFVSIQKCKP